VLDAYIIDRIRKEQEADDLHPPIRIEVPVDHRPPDEIDREEDDDASDRGITIIDYAI
jgi:hypothetical protein